MGCGRVCIDRLEGGGGTALTLRRSLYDAHSTTLTRRTGMVAPTKIIAGLGKSVGMAVLEVTGATGDYKSDFRAKAARMVEALRGGDYDFGFLHIKAVDDASHDRDVPLKIACLEVVDAMMGQLLRALRDEHLGDLVLAVTGDHSTPAEFGDHSHEPVPIVVSTVRDVVDVVGDVALDGVQMDALPMPEDLLGMPAEERLRVHFPWKRALMDGAGRGNGKYDDVAAFCELDGAKGCLGRFPGNLIVPTMQQIG